MKMVHEKSQEIIFEDIYQAEGFFKKAKGLIGTKRLKQPLLIPSCNWIHTFFMSIPIDVIYLNKEGVVKHIDHKIKPWRLPLPVLSANYVVETNAGAAEEKKIAIGDKYYVGN